MTTGGFYAWQTPEPRKERQAIQSPGKPNPPDEQQTGTLAGWPETVINAWEIALGYVLGRFFIWIIGILFDPNDE